MAAPLLTALPAAAAELNYTATAGADALHVTQVVPQGPVTDTYLDGGSPYAQVVLDTIGNSTGQSAGAYPGDAVAALPGMVTNVTGVPLPAVPLIVTSRHPTRPEGTASAGPVALAARSEERASEASAASSGAPGGPGGDFVARASAKEASSRIVATARNAASGVVVGPLTVASVRSSAEVIYDGKYKISTDFNVSGLSVAGLSFGVGQKGLTVAGQTIPLPDGSPVNAALKGAGISIRYLAPQQTATSVLAGALEVSYELKAPDGPVGGSTTVLQLGRAFAAVDRASAEAPATGQAGLPPEQPFEGEGSAGHREAPDAPSDLPVIPDALEPRIDSGSGAADGSGDLLDPALATAIRTPLPIDFYPPVVVAALFLVVAAQTVRMFGVRST